MCDHGTCSWRSFPKVQIYWVLSTFCKAISVLWQPRSFPRPFGYRTWLDHSRRHQCFDRAMSWEKLSSTGEDFICCWLRQRMQPRQENRLFVDALCLPVSRGCCWSRQIPSPTFWLFDLQRFKKCAWSIIFRRFNLFYLVIIIDAVMKYNLKGFLITMNLVKINKSFSSIIESPLMLWNN